MITWAQCDFIQLDAIQNDCGAAPEPPPPPTDDEPAGHEYLSTLDLPAWPSMPIIRPRPREAHGAAAMQLRVVMHASGHGSNDDDEAIALLLA